MKIESRPRLISFLLTLWILSSCNAITPPPLSSSEPSPSIPTPSGDQTGGAPQETPPSSSNPKPTPHFASCKSADPNFQCIGLKIVSYQDSNLISALSESESIKLVKELNDVWGQCQIGFQLESYAEVNPITFGLRLNPNWQTEGSQIRSEFSDNQTFLVVAIGAFYSATIAVTEMPGYAPFGTLVEKSYATNPLTVGHELGHYMGLYHYRDTTNLMNPYIGAHTELLNQSQCSTARATNLRYWTNMFR